MIDFTITKTRQRLIHQFKGRYGAVPLKIVIVTYNRLAYLQKCIASIHGSTTIPYEIIVMDDGSTDGTIEWLLQQRKRRKVTALILNNRFGTAQCFNMGIIAANSQWTIIANDDMYFHRWWDFAGLYVLNTEVDAATLTIYDYTNHSGIIQVKKEYDQVTGTGLGAAFVRTKSWEEAGQFKIKEGKKMGFFAGTFCGKVHKWATHKQHFITRPNWVHHMDLPTSKLSERDVLESYIVYRKKEKKGATG